jgi:hypothetical protein
VSHKSLLRFLDRNLDLVWAYVTSFVSRLLAPCKELINRVTAKIVTTRPPNDKSSPRIYVNTPWWQTLIEIVGVGLLLWYTIETHRGVSTAQGNFTKDQRPYIWTVQNQIPHVALNEKVSWNFQYNNFGKSPAIGVRHRCQIRLAAHGAHGTPELPDMFAPLHVRGHESEGLVVPPGDSSNWSTCESDEVITDADLKMMNAFDVGAKLMIFFEYYDTGRNRYTSAVCLFTRRMGQGPIGICPAENTIQ